MTGRDEVFQKAMNDGHSAAWDQLWDRAAACYRDALKEFPDNPKALNSLALALYQLQKFDEALEAYLQVAQISKDDPIPIEKAAQLYERLGSIKEAAESAMKAAELYLKIRDVDKAIENWARVTQLQPEHVVAHSRLALAHERLGHQEQAVIEYLAVASLLQHTGNFDKAVTAADRAHKLMPNSPEVIQARELLKAGQLLPKPVRPKGATGPLRMAQVRQLESPQKPTESGLNPIAEARQKALTILAEVLFEYSDQSSEAQARRGVQSILKGTGPLAQHKTEHTRIVLHLSQAIDAQTTNQHAQAAEELERALSAGFDHPALHFDLGLLRSKSERLESALRHLQQAIRHKDFAIATRLLMAQIHERMARYSEASIAYLEALKLADASVVPNGLADEVRQLYEPLIEAQSQVRDEKALKTLCKNISTMLIRQGWRKHLLQAREQLPKTGDKASSLPLAEVLIQSQSSQVLESINNIHQLARQGRLRSAMDQAFEALQYAPTYLPLHTIMGDLLVKEGHTQEAIAKFGVIASAYSVRGEASQATNTFRKILQLSPMDMNARTQLIEQLVARGQVDDAISEYLNLADIYYRLAELNMARKTYTTALRLAQQTSNSLWNVQILLRMADIDMQRLDWRQALRVYEQIRTLKPDDESVRRNLISINLRLAQPIQAIAELENYLTYLESNPQKGNTLTFIEKLQEEHPDNPDLIKAYARQLHRSGRASQAIAILDALGEHLLEIGDKPALIEVVNLILSMNPPDADSYRQLLNQI